jgi:pilus assembly protein CpaD
MLRRLVIAAFCLAGLAACEANMADYDYATRYPIKVETRTAVLILDPGPGGTINAADTSAIDEFARDFANRAAGTITVEVGGNSISDPLAMNFARGVNAALAARGVPPGAIQLSIAMDAESAKYGRAIMQYPIYVALADECGTIKDQPGFTPLNENTGGFGCANQRNLAAMVVNPRDLVDAQQSSGRLAARSSNIVGKYMIGAKIGASSETGAISVLGTTGGL